MKLCCLKTGEYIFMEGTEIEYLYIILGGNCKVFQTPENGKTILLPGNLCPCPQGLAHVR